MLPLHRALFVLVLALGSRPAAVTGAPSPVALAHKTVGGVPVKVVTVDLRSPRIRVRPLLAAGGPGHSQPLRALLRSRPAAAVTGTFFDLRSNLPIGDIVVDGRLKHFGGRGAALCLSANKQTGGTIATMRPNAGRDRHTNWRGCQGVLAGGMWLVRRGRGALDPRAQGFRDPGLFRPNPRVAVGLTKNGKLLLVATGRPVTLRQWARTLSALGARDALNLDGGSSTALYFRGRPVIHPGRRLTNALVVYESKGTRRARPG